MQVGLSAEQIGVLREIVGDEGLRKSVFTCGECRHYKTYNEPQAPINIAPYREAGAGCCTARKAPVKKNKRPCGRFELEELGNE